MPTALHEREWPSWSWRWGWPLQLLVECVQLAIQLRPTKLLGRHQRLELTRPAAQLILLALECHHRLLHIGDQRLRGGTGHLGVVSAPSQTLLDLQDPSLEVRSLFGNGLDGRVAFIELERQGLQPLLLQG